MSLDSIKNKISGITDGGKNTAYEIRAVLSDITNTFSSSTDTLIGMTFNTTNGILQLDSVSGSTYSADLDGRYLPLSANTDLDYITTIGNITTNSIDVSGVTTSYIQFPIITATTAVSEGELRWNGEDGTLNIGMIGGNVVLQTGQEMLVYAKANETILNGDVVYASGAVGISGRMLVNKFIANNTIQDIRMLGVATEDIPNGSFGYITVFGAVRGLDTTGVSGETWNEGDILYASETVAGQLTNVPPLTPNQTITTALLITKHVNNGVIFVRPTTGEHLDGLHDVLLTGLTNNDIIKYDSATGIWKNSPGVTKIYELSGTSTYNVNGNNIFTGTTNYSTIVGGLNNTSSGKYSVIGGGRLNTISDNTYSSILGGSGNTISNTNASIIAGGSGNTITFIPVTGNTRVKTNTISGGYGNTIKNNINATGVFKTNLLANTISGGYGNTISGNYNSIAGGTNHIMSGATWATIGGGDYNRIIGEFVGGSVIGGGYSNTASGWYNFIGTGRDNSASGDYSTISGGKNNTVSANYSTIAGGRFNTASSIYSFVGGGSGNTITSGTSYTTIGGGFGNSVTGGSYNTISGGYNNTASGSYSTIGGGDRNTASNTYSSISGGRQNIASGQYSTIAGGDNNTASGQYSTIGGGLNNNNSNYWATIAGGGYNTASGYGSFVGSGFQNTASNNYSTIIGGLSNISSGQYSAILNGRANRARTYGEVIIGFYATEITGTTTSLNPNDRIFGIGIGTSEVNRKDALNIFKDGRIDAPSLAISGITGNTQLITKEYGDANYLGGGAVIFSPTGNTTGIIKDGRNENNYGNVGANAVDLSYSNSASSTRGATGQYSFSAGWNNTASGYQATTLGGNNTASARYSTVGGGDNNTASNYWATIGGGGYNSASGYGSIVSGGFQNSASGRYSTIVGGNNGTASGIYSTVVGGRWAKSRTYGEVLLGVYPTEMTGSTAFSADFFYDADRILGVGIGTANSARKDALNIYKDGRIEAPSLAISGITGNTQLITKGYADVTYSAETAVYALSGTSTYNVNGNNIFTGTTNYSSILGGRNNITSGQYSFIGGGSGNTITTGTTFGSNGGVFGTISGGKGNTIIDGQYNTIAGGWNNTTSGYYSVIGGGRGNTSSGYSVVAGGWNNIANRGYTFIGGGYGNIASTWGITIGGGLENTASAYYANIVGGRQNTASGQYSFIGGGYQNTASAWYGIIGGGSGNTITIGRNYGIISGGFDNIISGGTYGIIGGGRLNKLGGQYATIGGGNNNTVSGDYGVIGGGYLNKVSNGSYGFIGNGSNNSASGDYSIVVGGVRNKIYNSKWSFIGAGDTNTISGNTGGKYIIGGYQNTISTNSGYYGFIGVGYLNTVSNSYSTIINGKSNTNSGGSTTIVGGSFNTVSSNYSIIGGGLNNTVSSKYSIIVGGEFNTITSGGTYGFIGNGTTNTVSGYRSTIINGWDMKANGHYSTVLGGREMQANSYGETVTGLYGTVITGNTNTWVGSDRLFNLGNGKSVVNRSDAFTIYKDGRTVINGPIGEVINKTGTTHTLSGTEVNDIVTFNNGSPVTLTVPPNSGSTIPMASSFVLINKGAGTVTISGGVGVTINQNIGGLTMAQHDVRTIRKIDTDLWSLGY